MVRDQHADAAAVSGAFGTAEKLADDVWQCMYAEAERRIADARTAWGRGTCRVARQLARTCYRLVCRGYHAKQNRLIRGFAAALPA